MRGSHPSRMFSRILDSLVLSCFFVAFPAFSRQTSRKFHIVPSFIFHFAAMCIPSTPILFLKLICMSKGFLILLRKSFNHSKPFCSKNAAFIHIRSSSAATQEDLHFKRIQPVCANLQKKIVQHFVICMIISNVDRRVRIWCHWPCDNHVRYCHTVVQVSVSPHQHGTKK